MKTLDFSAFFQTKAQATDFSSRIATVSEKIYETEFDLEKSLMTEFGLKKKELLLTMLRDNEISAESPKKLKDFLADLQKDITSLPVLAIKIAFEPNDKNLKAFSEWFVMNTKNQVLFDITVDRRLVAGAIFNFNGRDADYTIKDKFLEIVHDFVVKSSPSNTVTVNLPHPEAKRKEETKEA
jgi:F0F1-type ATP synthase delta subunit